MAKVIDLFVAYEMISRKDLDKIVSAGMGNEPSHQLAVRTGLVSEDDYLSLLTQEYGYQLLEQFPEEEITPEEFKGVSPLFMDEHCFFPIKCAASELQIVVNDPFDHLIFDTLKKVYPGKRIELFLSRKEKIRQWVSQTFYQEGEQTEETDTADEEFSASGYGFEDAEHLKDLASEAPVIKKVNQILTSAVEERASDIHIEPFDDRLQVRFRCDGILQDHMVLPVNMQQAVTTRLKIMARLDISERRIPQDGGIRTKIAGKNIDLRLSCLPTVYGESVVMRILDRSSASFSLQKLGFPQREHDLFQDLIHLPYGIILITGPTGSGKTTTLYSALNTINSQEKKIITIEDPVEYELDGINQIQVNQKAGLTFAGGLRSIVRQDPDVILIGEIRDKETADIAIQSALTGHLVFSTLHTNDAAGAITRLIEIGVEDYLLSSSLIGIMAQRLIRILCPYCKKEYYPDEHVLKRYGFSLDDHQPLYQPVGCSKCGHTGYRERTAVFELLVITDEIRELILKNKSTVSLRNKGVEQGMKLLRHDSWNKVVQGKTSMEEVLRVTGQ